MRVLMFVAGALLLSVGLSAQGKAVTGEAAAGKQYFEQFCVTCHGATAKGDGPLASTLRTRPANLATLALRNDGTFPTDRVRTTIDGRNRTEKPKHTDMPEWRDVFEKSAEGLGPEGAKDRIDAIVKYLEQIQEKR